MLSSEVASQMEIHAAHGGVVPEIAAGAHVVLIDSVITAGRHTAGVDLDAIDGVAATGGPGLIGGVVVGTVAAKAIATARGIPYYAVNHLEGHALSPRLVAPVAFPYLLLLVSGGHTQLLAVHGPGDYERYGTTMDDAAGEAFDKGAKIMGLGYPGGPAVERLAAEGDASRVPLPRPLKGADHCHFSFSGLKTAVATRHAGLAGTDAVAADLAASLQAAIADCLADRARRAMAVCRRPRRVNAGNRGRRGCQPSDLFAPRDGSSKGGIRPVGATGLAVHRQRRDDRLGRHRAPWRTGRTELRATPPLATGSGRRAASGTRRAGMTGALVIGGGSWGTALAHALRCGTATPRILVREPETSALLAGGRCRQLADLPPVDGFDATTDPSAISEAEMVFLVVPVAATAELLRQVDTLAAPGTPVVLCAKGLVVEGGHPRFMTELAADLCPHRPVVIMSGPTFADEVLQGLPAAITAAGHDEAAVTSVQSLFGKPPSCLCRGDPLGSPLAGMKNVIAIAAGCASGLGLGDNEGSADRGPCRDGALRHRRRRGTGHGLRTVGAGDLALTCAGPHSRNMAYGLALGRGEAPSQKLAEGRHGVAALAACGRALGVELPITDGVDGLVNRNDDLRQVVARLLARRVGVE